MFENPRRGSQARNFTTNVPKILVLKSSSEQRFSRKLPLGAPEQSSRLNNKLAFSGNKKSIFPYFSCLCTHGGMWVYARNVPELIFLHNDFRRYRRRLVLRYAFYFQSYR